MLRIFLHAHDKWDCVRGHYRKGWCRAHEIDIESAGRASVDARWLVVQVDRAVKRAFELMRGEDRVLKRQADGARRTGKRPVIQRASGLLSQSAAIESSAGSD